MSLELYKEVVDRIRKQNKNLIINLTTGPGGLFVPNFTNLNSVGEGTSLKTAEERVKHVQILKPDICSLDFNTMNLEGPGIRLNHKIICGEMLKLIQEAGTKPELEIFDSGDLRMARELLDNGQIKKPALWQFAMGIKYGWEATAETLNYAFHLLPEASIWSAFGIGRTQMPMVAMTAIYGGHVRVGMEDNIYAEKGVLAKSNAELVQKAVRIISDIGGQVANPSEARVLMGLKN